MAKLNAVTYTLTLNNKPWPIEYINCYKIYVLNHITWAFSKLIHESCTWWQESSLVFPFFFFIRRLKLFMLQNDNDRIKIIKKKQQQQMKTLCSFFLLVVLILCCLFCVYLNSKKEESSKLNYMLYACIRLNYVEDKHCSRE